MPTVRPFRALRYDPEAIGDLGRVIAPPYDVIGPDEHRALLALDPRNVVRLDLPAGEPGDADPDDRYRRAARFLAARRGDGTLRQDPRPSIYVYEQQFRRPGSADLESRRGFFARVGLEPFGDAIRPHERTLPGPREDRYRLLRATNVNTSPIVALYRDTTGRVGAVLESVDADPHIVDTIDAGGQRHRLWALTAGGDGRAEALIEGASGSALTIADGHHRYETALRYQAERRAGSALSGQDEPGHDFVLMLLLEPVAGPVVVLPTHRIVRGLESAGLNDLEASLGDLCEMRRGATAAELIAAFGAGTPAAPSGTGGAGRFGLWTRNGGSVLHARRAAFEAILPPGGPAVRRLDVTLLGALLEAAAGLDTAAVAEGARLVYTKDVAEAIAIVDAATDGADAAFLLDPTSAEDIIAVAAEGDVMPQKSTYIYPKAFTGLVINPLES